jgi:hypothetical protein
MSNLVALFLFLKGMTGALAPFSYLMLHTKNFLFFIKLWSEVTLRL